MQESDRTGPIGLADNAGHLDFRGGDHLNIDSHQYLVDRFFCILVIRIEPQTYRIKACFFNHELTIKLVGEGSPVAISTKL